VAAVLSGHGTTQNVADLQIRLVAGLRLGDGDPERARNLFSLAIPREP
jgi:hypothetical protein